MEVNNPLYKNQGIHVITSVFTVEDGVVKVLLIKRKNSPYQGMWALVGGALYNNENLLDGVQREVFEKSGIENINLYLSGIFGEKNRSPVMRMIGISFIGLIDREKVKVLKETLKTSNAEWFSIENIPELAYDHNEVIDQSLITLKEKIVETNILKSLFPTGFIIPELQEMYEIVLNSKLDKRNFRKKILSNPIIIETDETRFYKGTKPAQVYRFKEDVEENKIF